jgi:hypothetical protein
VVSARPGTCDLRTRAYLSERARTAPEPAGNASPPPTPSGHGRRYTAVSPKAGNRIGNRSGPEARRARSIDVMLSHAEPFRTPTERVAGESLLDAAR